MNDLVFPTLPPLISVQPMTGPIGGVAFLRPRYGSWVPSIVDRLAALADPKMARRILEYDEPARKYERYGRNVGRYVDEWKRALSADLIDRAVKTLGV